MSLIILQRIHRLTLANKDEEVETSISIGFASTDNIPVDNPESLLECADQALYTAYCETRGSQLR